jgi:hypothetical protein
MSDWIGLPEIIDIDKHFAIIYKITNTINNKKYIGKKQLFSKTTKPPLKGKKRKRIEYRKSDYEKYYGSSEELKKDVALYGKENFTREVLEIVSCKWEAAYIELYFQIKEGVMFRDDYYNGILNIRLAQAPRDLTLLMKYVDIPKTDDNIIA